MQKFPLIIVAASFAAILSLSACNSESETVTAVGPADPNAQNVANAAPVVLPPAVTASRSYRCKDNSLAYVDFYADGTTADVRAEKNGAATRVTAPAKGEPFVAEGYKLVGDGTTVTLEQPGKPSQSCKA